MEYSKSDPCWCDCIGGGNGGYCKLPPNSCGDCPARIAQARAEEEARADREARED